MELIKSSFRESLKVLDDFRNNRTNLRKIWDASEIILQSLRAGGKIISFGNGGSMCDAMHFAEELTGRYRENRLPIAAIAVSDSSHITCISNDYGFTEIFSRFIEAHGKPHDVVLAISTSGDSVNVIKACKVAHKIGLKVIALTGKTGGKLAGLADIEIRVSHDGYSDRIQEVHIVIIHILVELIEKGLIQK